MEDLIREAIQTILSETDDQWLERVHTGAVEELKKLGFELRPRFHKGYVYEIIATPFGETQDALVFGGAAEIEIGLISHAFEKLGWKLVSSSGGVDATELERGAQRQPSLEPKQGEDFVIGTSDVNPGTGVVIGRLTTAEKKKDFPRWSWKTIPHPENEPTSAIDEPDELIRPFTRVFVKGNFRCKVTLEVWWGFDTGFGEIRFSHR